jgi:hypothetical protein
LQAKYGTPVQPRYTALAKPTLPVKRTSANTGTSSDTLPGKRPKPEVTADATRLGNPDKANIKQDKACYACTCRHSTAKEETPPESAADGNSRNTKSKPDKAAMITTIPPASGSGTVSTDMRSSSSTGKK